MKIIVETELDPVVAMSYVQAVMCNGRISEAGDIKHYCWHTSFNDGTQVSVRRKRSEEAADSFIVYR